MPLNILGVKIDQYGREEVLEKIISFLSSDQKRYIATPNPEILIEAQKDEEFFYILNRSDLSLPDGIGLKIASWFLGENLKVTKGADLLPEIVKISYDRKIKISFILWQNGLTKNALLSNYLNTRYPNLNFQIIETDRDHDNFNIKELEQFQPDIMVVALGAPYQEKFIYHTQQKIVNLKLSIGIGGAIDFLTGEIKRAPKFLRNIGLEWLWRLFKQPWRWKRIYNAIFVFLCVFFKQHFINGFFYRNNVVAFIYQDDEVLILDWSEDKNYWGLPQGGVERNESYEEALKREVEEETGLKNIKIVKKIKNIYKYKWPKCYYHTGYKGQKQTLFFVEYSGEKNKVKVNPYEHKNYKWVKINDLIKESNNVHAEAYSLFLKNF